MNFKSWFESSLKDVIGGVPQRPDYHAEGDVFQHTQMVRQQLNLAIADIQAAAKFPDSPFSSLNLQLTSADENILRIAVWLHDVGKASATRIDRVGTSGKKRPWKRGMDVVGREFSLSAAGHENPDHFEPMMKKLGPTWQRMYLNASSGDREDLWWIIRNHMALAENFGFGRTLTKEMAGPDGKFRNTRRIKLLLILILMDWRGRLGAKSPTGDAAASLALNLMGKSAGNALKWHQNALNRSVPAPNDPREFVHHLTEKTPEMPLQLILRALRGKFGREFDPSEVSGWL